MELKTIIAIALVAFIIGGFFCGCETERRNNGWGGAKTPSLFLFWRYL